MMIVHKAKIVDLEELIRLKLLMFEDAGYSEILASDANELILGDYKTLYQDNKVQHFIIKKDGKIVAMVGAFIKSDLPYCYYKIPYYGFIGDVYTVKKYRGNGFATLLTNHALEWLTSKDIGTIRLLASKDASKLYEKFGFKTSDEMYLDLKDRQ